MVIAAKPGCVLTGPAGPAGPVRGQLAALGRSKKDQRSPTSRDEADDDLD